MTDKIDWDGEGLPPTGCECLARLSGSISAEWFAFCVVAVDCDCVFGWAGKEACSLGSSEYEFTPAIAVDPRRAVLDELFTFGEMFYQQRFSGCDVPPTLEKYRKDAIDRALEKLTNLPPF